MHKPRIGLSPSIAGQFARRIEIALRGGNWAEAREVLDQACQAATVRERVGQTDARDLTLHEIGLPQRTVTMLEHHGMFEVQDLLRVSVSWLATLKHVGPGTIDAILRRLWLYGITEADFAEEDSDA